MARLPTMTFYVDDEEYRSVTFVDFQQQHDEDDEDDAPDDPPPALAPRPKAA